MSLNYQNLTPLTDRVLIKPDVAGEKKIGGIIIPDLGRDKASTGIVVAVGPGRVSDHGVFIPLTVRVGDHVMFNAYGASDLNVDGQTLFKLHEGEIDCIIRA